MGDLFQLVDNDPPPGFGPSGHRAKLTAGQAREIYRRVLAGERPGPLGAEFGIHEATVRSIRAGESWAAVTGARDRRLPRDFPAPGPQAPDTRKRVEPCPDSVLRHLTRVSMIYIPAEYGWRRA